LGDIGAELLAIAMLLTLFGHAMFGAWVYDFMLAFAFGIAFQYSADARLVAGPGPQGGLLARMVMTTSVVAVI
jgi:hypothetical protein